MEDCFTYLNNMPAAIRGVAEMCWDYTGRPIYGNSYNIAVGRILAMSNDYDEFVEKYSQLFPQQDVSDWVLKEKLDLIWHVYITGMKSLANRLGVK